MACMRFSGPLYVVNTYRKDLELLVFCKLIEDNACGTTIAYTVGYGERRAIMHDVTLWAAWYLFLLAIPVLLVGSFLRERVALRRISRRTRIR